MKEDFRPNYREAVVLSHAIKMILISLGPCFLTELIRNWEGSNLTVGNRC